MDSYKDSFTLLNNNNSIPFNYLLFMCQVNSYKANYRHNNNNNNNNNNKSSNVGDKIIQHP
jgi:hypothetical protein